MMDVRQIIEGQMRKSACTQALWFVIWTAPLSMLWELITTFRNLLFDVRLISPKRLPGVTMAVGNLEMGGTGKSPLTGLLARGLVAHGHRPAILSRGYGVKIKRREVLWIQDGVLKSSRTGTYDASKGLPDEARMLSAMCPGTPVICSPNRWLSAQWLLRAADSTETISHWVLDDGFQHRSLFRDHNIAVVDGARPYGNGWCLPRGSLREAIGGIWRSTVIVSSGDEASTVGLPHIPTFALEIKSAQLMVPGDGRFIHWDSKSLGEITLMTAIARPERVVATLRDRFQVTPHSVLFKGDHVGFSRDQIEEVLAAGRQIVVTEKDYWRHPDIWQAEQGKVLVLVLDWHINDKIWSILLR